MNAEKKQMTKSVLAISVPLALQSLLSLLVNLVDTIMVGRQGTVALAGVSQANQIFFIVALTVPGIAAGASVLVSQAWGRRDVERIHKIIAYAYRVALIFIILLTILVEIFPETVMGIYTSDPEAIHSGTVYLRIVAWSYIFYAVTNITTGVLRSVRTVTICLYGSIVSVVLNIVGNYMLIEGHLGCPALGVAGAAIATLIARVAEFAVILLYVYFKEDKIKIRVHKMIKLDKSLAKIFFSTSIPVICNEMFWAFGMSAHAVILGRLGSEVVAANSVGSSVTQMASVVMEGIAAAACVMVGNNVGAGNYEIIGTLKKYFQRVAFSIGLMGSVLILCLIPAVPSIYHISGQTYEYCRQFLYVSAFIVPCTHLQGCNMMGWLRGAGDVRFQMANDLFFLWGVTVPLGFFMAFVVHAPIIVIYICLECDQFIKIFTSEWRLRSGKWIHNMNVTV